jgi:hypothetical protein
MRTPLHGLGLAIVLVTGCSGPLLSPAGPDSTQSISAVSTPGGQAAASPLAASAVPFTGRLEGIVTITPLEPPLAFVLIDGGGQATRLGRFTMSMPHVVNFATAMGEGTIELTAANGDILRASFTGQADTTTPVFAIVESATIVGGTGRFGGATGSFTMERLFDSIAGTTTGSFEGTISMRGVS